jgi:hypothetical protein
MTGSVCPVDRLTCIEKKVHGRRAYPGNDLPIKTHPNGQTGRTTVVVGPQGDFLRGLSVFAVEGSIPLRYNTLRR